MPSKYQKYDIATKVSLVEEYLELSKTVKITKADFAYQKGISDSTFNSRSFLSLFPSVVKNLPRLLPHFTGGTIRSG